MGNQIKLIMTIGCWGPKMLFSAFWLSFTHGCQLGECSCIGGLRGAWAGFFQNLFNWYLSLGPQNNISTTGVMADNLFLGEHYIAEFYDCQFDSLNSPQGIEAQFLDCAKICNATVISSNFHHFEPFGVSGVVIIAESHMTVHTWPEYRYAAVDVFTCSTKMQSAQCVNVLKDKFKCMNYTTRFIPRGMAHSLQMSAEDFEKSREFFIKMEDRQKEIATSVLVSDSWIYEEGQYSRFGIPFTTMLHHKKSQFQDVKIVDSPTMGRTLLLDNVFMICEKTEENYHQMMVHPSVQLLLLKGKQALDVLIIGGGDGGAARELLRYPQVNKIKVAELDGEVIESCRKFIPKTAAAFDHPKVEIALGDGLAYVADTADKWDLILCDGCDPIGEGANLFSNNFYTNCYRILKPDGIFLTQGESPYAYNSQFLSTNKILKEVFGAKNASLLLYHQPIYEFGLWSFQFAMKSEGEEGVDLKKLALSELSEDIVNEFAEEHDLKYYNYEVHLASLAIPNAIKKMLQSH